MARLTNIRDRVHAPFFDTLAKATTKTDLTVLMRTFGYDEGMRLAQLPGDDPERQRALAEAALAGEIVGEQSWGLDGLDDSPLSPGMSK